MSRTTEQHHDADPAQQLTLLSQGELAQLQSSFAFRSGQGEIGSHKVPRQDGEEHVAQKDGYIQDALPSLQDETV